MVYMDELEGQRISMLQSDRTKAVIDARTE